jgi:hypothetical protein
MRMNAHGQSDGASTSKGQHDQKENVLHRKALSVKIQTEFMETQVKSFNDQARVISEIYAKAAQDAMKRFT